jgi:hypothetical protein
MKHFYASCSCGPLSVFGEGALASTSRRESLISESPSSSRRASWSLVAEIARRLAAVEHVRVERERDLPASPTIKIG